MRPLLPPPGCLAIVTSRQRFALPGLFAQNIEQMPAGDALLFLLKLARRLEGERTAAGCIAELCGYLPLALRAAGSLLDIQPDLDSGRYAAELQTETTRLEKIGTEGVEIGVEASLNLSYRRLPAETAAVFRALAVFPATFDSTTAGAVGGDGAAARVSELLRYSLVEWDSAAKRYRLHDLARAFADGQLSDAERETAGRRHADYYMRVLSAGDEMVRAGGTQYIAGLELYDRDAENIHAGQAWAAARASAGDDLAQLCANYSNAGVYVLNVRLHMREWIRWLESGLAAAQRLKDRQTEGSHLGNLGIAHAALGETRRAIDFHGQALAVMREVGDRRGEGGALTSLGNAHGALGETRRAIEFFKQALVIDREIGDQRGEGAALGNLGGAYKNLGETRRAIEFHEQALDIDRETDDQRGEGNALGSLGLAYADLGDMGRAIEFYEQRLAIAREVGDRRGEGGALTSLGNAHGALGETRRAIEFFKQALVIDREIGDRRGEGNALGSLGIAYAVLGETRRAIEFFEQHLTIAREIGDRGSEGSALWNMAVAQETLGGRKRAIANAQASLKIRVAIEDPRAEKVRLQLELWQAALTDSTLSEPGGTATDVNPA